MITVKHGVFHLQNEKSSYLFRVRDGFLEHLHFGTRLSASDADALAVRPGNGWGDSTLYREGSNANCLDIFPLEWSGCGRGDYRESPMELLQNGAPISTEFRYIGCEALKSAQPSALPASRGQTFLAVYLEDSAAKLRLTLLYGVLPTVFTRRAILENCGDTPISIRKLMSANTDLPGDWTLHTFSGGWIAEMQHTETPITMARTCLESTTGASSSRANPGFLLAAPDAAETAGEVCGFNLLYSGSHYLSAQKSLQGLTRVMHGISPANFNWELAPGERFETPEAVMAWSDAGFGGITDCFGRYVNEALIPPYWKNRPRPIVYNSWEGCMFDFTEAKLLRLGKLAKQLGCELFVLDDGWFGKRDSDTSSLGDYSVNAKKLPNGLKGLGEKRIVSYHEVGHALVAALQKHSQPVSKITIVPHTSGALGYTMQMPEEEKFLSSREELIVELQTMLGGRAAEQVVFGIATTGASNDSERATELARKMVTQYGMSDKLGLMALSTVSNPYLDGSTMMNCADSTSSAADEEIHKLLMDCYADAKKLLVEHRSLLDEIAMYLLSKETITGDEFMAYVNADSKRLTDGSEAEEPPEQTEAPSESE